MTDPAHEARLLAEFGESPELIARLERELMKEMAAGEMNCC